MIYNFYEDRLEKRKKIIEGFEKVLKNSKEQGIHNYLKKTHKLINYISARKYLLSKYKLADKYVTDFIVIGIGYGNLLGVVINFIEIERADLPLFTKKGDPTSFLTHAIKQVQDWEMWVTDNLLYFKNDLQKHIFEMTDNDYNFTNSEAINKKIDKVYERKKANIINSLTYGILDRYYVIAGRRNSMTIKDRENLNKINRNSNKINVITYDVLIDELLNDIDLYDGYGFDLFGNFRLIF
jgi:hypothetical protein